MTEIAIPPRLDEKSVAFLAEYVENGGDLKSATQKTWGKLDSDSLKLARKLIVRPDARKYMHKLRMANNHQLFHTVNDLIVELEAIALRKITPMKYRMQAFRIIAQLLRANDPHTQVNIAVGGLRESLSAGLSKLDIAAIRARVIGIDSEILRSAQESHDKDEYIDSLSILTKKTAIE